MTAVVVDNPGAHRFELRLDDRIVGTADYLPAGDSVIVAHTQIDEGHEGEGLGGLLVRETLNSIRASGKSVIPTCPFAAAYIRRHAEFVPLVDPSLRNQFTAVGPPLTGPAEPLAISDRVDESNKGSFPASDPPSWWAGP